MGQLSKTDVHVKDLRTIGIMVPLKKVRVADHTSFENNNVKCSRLWQLRR
jgi:hypothetical protein